MRLRRLRRYPIAVIELFYDTLIEWLTDKASMLAAGLAYYTIFSLTPIVILLVTIGSRLLQNINVQEAMYGYASEYINVEIADFIQNLLLTSNRFQNSSNGTVVTVISATVVFWGASGVFSQLKRTLNIIWGVEPKPRSGMARRILHYLQTRILAVVMVLMVGVLLSLSLFLNAIMGDLNGVLAQYLPEISALLNSSATSLILFGVMSVLFAIIYRVLPDVTISWRDVWLGGVVTAVFFSLGNFALGKYIQARDVGSAFDAAGSLIMLLVWIYYSAQIFFFGAEFTKVYANRYGSRVVPADNAIAVHRELIYEDTPSSTFPVSLPRPLYDVDVVEEPTAVTTQKIKQAAFGLFGLALGLFIGYWQRARARANLL